MSNFHALTIHPKHKGTLCEITTPMEDEFDIFDSTEPSGDGTAENIHAEMGEAQFPVKDRASGPKSTDALIKAHIDAFNALQVRYDEIHERITKLLNAPGDHGAVLLDWITQQAEQGEPGFAYMDQRLKGTIA